MSGIVAVARRVAMGDDDEEIRSLTKAMSFRGPDGLAWRRLGQAALGSAHMYTRVGQQDQPLPLRLDDAPVWITADARIDAQADLVRALAATGRQVPPQVTDAEFILHAYLCWDTDCLQHLLGDFCFAIWDERQQCLFAARDHFGIKPLFHAALAEGVLVGNTLQVMTEHPELGAEHDDLFMADFLLFGESREPESTAYAGIRRLRAGHALRWSAHEGRRIWRYWQLPVFEPRTGSQRNDEVGDFFELLKTVVRDRLRTERIGLELSGGMDSTSLAVMARLCLLEDTGEADMLGVSVVYDEWMPDEERHYASMAAGRLSLPAEFVVAESFRLFDQPANGWQRPEPVMDLLPTLKHHVLARSAAFGRTWLTGWDGDALLSEPLRPFLRCMVRQRKYGDWVGAVVSFLGAQGPLWLSGWRQRWRQRTLPLPPEEAPLRFPDWIHPDLVDRLNLKARWQNPPQTWRRIDDTPRPYAYQVLSQMAEDGRAFEHYDPGIHGFAIDYRHPLMDLRLIEHCLRLPVQPWCIKKHILRQAMRPHLPKLVVNRPKTPLPTSPIPPLLQRDTGSVQPWPIDAQKMQPIVNLDKLIPWNTWLAKESWNQRPIAWEQAGRPWVLGQWLQHRRPAHHQTAI